MSIERLLRVNIMVRIGTYEVNLDYQYYDMHIWVNRESDNEVFIGLTDYGQQSLKDIISIDPPSKSQRFAEGKPLLFIESISKDFTMKSPVSCVILEVNQEVIENPEILNEKPFDAWIVRAEVLDLSDFDKLMDGEDMADLLAEEVDISPVGNEDGLDDEFDYENELAFDSSDDYYNDYEDDDFYDYDADDY